MLADRGAAIATFETRKGSVERSNEVPQVVLRLSRHSIKCVHTSRCISDQNSTRKLLCALVSSLPTKCVHTYFLRNDLVECPFAKRRARNLVGAAAVHASLMIRLN